VPRRRNRQGAAETAEAAAEPTPCFVTNVDEFNERVIVYHEPIRRGVRMLHAFERDGDTVFDFVYDEASRRRMREFVDRLRNHPGSRLFEVPAEFAYCLLQKLRRRAEEAGRAFPSGFLSSLTRLDRKGACPDRHPYHDMVDGAAVLARLGQFDGSDALHAEPEFAGWQIGREAARSLQLSLEDMQSSGLLINEEQRGQQIGARVARMIDAVYGGPRRASFADRFRDIAWLLAKRGAAPQAETAAALALALDDPNREIASIPFFQQCVRNRLRVAEPRSERPEDHGGLII
jgi:hypothetical protein